MLRLKKYNEYLNEGIRDKMIPKSDEDIKQSFKDRNYSFRGELIASTYINDVDNVEPILDLMYEVYITTDSEEIKETIEDDYLKGLDSAVDNGGYELVELYLSYDIPGLGMSHLRMALDTGNTGVIEIIYDRLKDGMSEEEREEIENELDDNELNEGLRDKMTPKPLRDIEESLSSLSKEKLNDIFVKAVTGDDIDTLKFILPYVDLNYEDQLLDICELAVDLYHMEVLDLLLEQGIDEETKSKLIDYIEDQYRHSAHKNMWLSLVKRPRTKIKK